MPNNQPINNINNNYKNNQNNNNNKQPTKQPTKNQTKQKFNKFVDTFITRKLFAICSYLISVKEIGNGRSPLLQEPLYGTRPQPYSE